MDPPGAGGHGAGRCGDLREAGVHRGVEGRVADLPLVGIRVAVEVLGRAGGVAWVALE